MHFTPNRQRLIDTVLELCAAQSPTGAARPAADTLHALLERDGFQVERPAAGHPESPAVVVRLDSGRPGRTLQFNGHLDVVHLPYVPPRVEGDRIRGSGSIDMKGGTAAAVEALRLVRDSGALTAGSVLLTAHDLHEAPWGFGLQLDTLIREGCHADAVLIPEYLNTCLPVAGRGSATWKVHIRRAGEPVHEVLRPDEPSVIAAAAVLITRLEALARRLAGQIDPVAGAASVFIGQLHSGEIFNQYPQVCWLEGTRRWLSGTAPAAVEAEFRDLCAGVAVETGTMIDVAFQVIRDAFRLDTAHPFVALFQQVYTAETGQALPTGPKLFVDDGNSFWSLAGVPCITHGPTGGGPHTVEEWVSISDLERVARLYATVAAQWCAEPAVTG